MSYEGWNNKETWDVHLWIREDPQILGSMVNAYIFQAEEEGWIHAKEEIQWMTVADDLKNMIPEYVYDLMGGEKLQGMASQLLQTALSSVDYDELGKSYHDEIVEAVQEEIDKSE